MIADPWAPAPATVGRVVHQTPDVVTLSLRPPEPMPFAPGQFHMLTAYGQGEVPISLSGDPATPDELWVTIRGVGQVTRSLIAAVPGTEIGLRGPFGIGWPVDAAEGHDVVLVAGGIGLAPLRPVMLHLLQHRERYGRIGLLVGARTPADLLFADELQAWRGRFDLDIEVTVDRGDAGWRGSIGVVTRLLHTLAFDPSDGVLMTCGPEIMMRFVAQAALERGVAADRVFVSMERNMQCGFGLCGHCQWGPHLVCRDGPVFAWEAVAPLFPIRGL